jgi:hypothetical protein
MADVEQTTDFEPTFLLQFMGQFAQYKNISVQMMVSKSAPWQPIIINGANDDNTQRFTGIDYLNVDTLNVATSDLLDIFNIQGSAGMSSLPHQTR